MKQVENNELVNLMDMAMVRNGSGESAVVDFVVQLLRCIGYDCRHRVARRRVDLPFLVCGELRSTRMDVSLVNIVNGVQGDILLLVQEDKQQLEGAPPRDARSQLVVNAVLLVSRRYSLAFQVMPGIVMDGTAPTFRQPPRWSPIALPRYQIQLASGSTE
ncbi:hypothetical protein CPC08DRAFT_711806 [Agrocybe pediades]|nr:hypothetical protein CPC08DRAFT_711806 [Agrocybe pediades]